LQRKICIDFAYFLFRYIAKLAPLFEMVNVIDEEEPQDEKFRPDGVYYPRIMFMSK